MKNPKIILLFSILMGLFLHGAAFFGIQNLPLKTFSTKLAIKPLFFEKENQVLTEVFQNIIQMMPERIETFRELKPEYAPTLEIGFPQKEPTFDFMSLEAERLELKGFEEEDVPIKIESKDFLITTPSLKTKLPSFEMAYEDDPYVSFGTLAGSEHFDVVVEYAQKRFRPGYVFKITFQPKPDVQFKRISQNCYFLIDRSNSIPKARYALNKKVVSQALDLLKANDHFNILIFDDKVIRLSENPLEFNETNVALARQFLEKIPHGGHFAATELYSSLGKIIPRNVSDQEVNSAILLSDGDTFLSVEKQRQTIGKWTLSNKGKIALFAVASGNGNNLTLLDLISSFNKGYLIYTQDHTELQERVNALMRSIQNPIGKEMVATALSSDKHMQINLQPKQIRLPDLYQHRPFVIYGSTNRLSDFVVFLQGKYYDRRFDIKKKISFSQAKLGSLSIERQWMQALVQELYERFFEDGNFSHLEMARQLLTPLNLPTLFLE